MPSPNDVISQKVAEHAHRPRPERDPGALHPVVPELCEPAADDVLGGLLPGRHRTRRTDPGHQQRRDQEGAGVGQRDQRDAAERGQHPAERAAHEPRQVLGLTVERVGGHQLGRVRVVDDPRQHCLLGRGEERLHDRLEHQHRVDDPDQPGSVHEQQREQPDREHQVGGDHGPPPVPAVDQDAGDEADQHLRQQRGQEDPGRGHRRAGQVVDGVRQPDGEQPVAGQRDQRGSHQSGQVRPSAEQPPRSPES